MRRARRLANGGTFLVAVALAVQLGQRGALADDNLLITLPVAFLGAMLSGWVLRPSAALAMAAAVAAAFATLGVSQTGSAYTDEMLLFGIPFSAAAAIVVGHCRGWSGRAAILMAVICAALAIGIGMTESPVPFVIAHLAVVISLPTIPIRRAPLATPNQPAR
jgi:hypothetical protein